MAKATTSAEQNLTPIESQLLDNPKFGAKLRRGGSVQFEDLSIADRQKLGLQQGDSISLNRNVLNQLSRGRGQSNQNIVPIPSLQDVVRGLQPKRITPNVIDTNEGIVTSAGKGSKKKIGQRNIQEIQVRDQNKNILETLASLLRGAQSNVPVTSPFMQQGVQGGQEVAYQTSQLVENLLRNLQSQINKPRPSSMEQDVFSAVRSQVGLPVKQAAGSVVTVGNKRYKVDASGRITQILDPMV